MPYNEEVTLYQKLREDRTMENNQVNNNQEPQKEEQQKMTLRQKIANTKIAKFIAKNKAVISAIGGVVAGVVGTLVTLNFMDAKEDNEYDMEEDDTPEEE